MDGVAPSAYRGLVARKRRYDLPQRDTPGNVRCAWSAFHALEQHEFKRRRKTSLNDICNELDIVVTRSNQAR
ncbi:ABC-type cobalamin transport system ATPase subunit [Rhodanobacter sp. A1T4]|jgi:ABC-type cobalamin transport system ATPase subunit|nr:ABC-type cobalamin transport system ATPase subunit [Rhodanobacter sp. A1T4]